MSVAVLGFVHAGHFGHVYHICRSCWSKYLSSGCGTVAVLICGGWQGLRVDPLTCTTQPHNAHRHQGNVLKMWGPQATLGILSIPEHNFEQMFLWGAGNWETLFSKPTSLGRMLNGECNMICNMKILSDIEKFNNPELLVAECPSDAYCHRHCWKD